MNDSEIFTAEQETARLEGIFAEPSSFSTIAAIEKLVDEGKSVVCLITGSGMKATDVLQALVKNRKSIAVGLNLSTKEKILGILSR